MSGQRRLPGAEVRTVSIAEAPCQSGEKVRWRDRAGIYRRKVDDEHAEVTIGERIYRVRRAELRQG
jgi:hypothetical protein